MWRSVGKQPSANKKNLEKGLGLGQNLRKVPKLAGKITSMNARHSERKRRDSFSLSIREALYLTKELETACNPLINSWESTCFKLIGAQGRNSFIAADTPATFSKRER